MVSEPNHVTEASQESLLASGFKSNYPNFEAERHWPRKIKFLGPPWFQNTKHWETQHSGGKGYLNWTN